jgi:integrase
MRPLRLSVKRITWGSYATKPGFLLAGIRENGKIKRRFFPTEAEATQEKDRLEAEAKALGDLANKLTHDQVNEAVNANISLAPFKRTVREAVEHFINHLKQLESTVPVSELVDKYIKAKDGLGLSRSHLTDTKYRLRVFEEAFGDQPTRAITTRDVSEWLPTLPVGPQSRINYWRALHALFNFAVAQKYASENPVTRVDRPKKVDRNPGVLAPEQFARLLEAADERLRPALAIAGFAGLRPAEVQRVKWDNVRLAERLIVLDASITKTAKRRLVPICDNLLAWLMGAPSKKGPVALPFTTHRKLLKTARKDAEIKEWPVNALRHSWVTYRFALTGDAIHTAAEAGHDQTMLENHYKALVTRADAERWFAIMPGGQTAKTVAFEPTAVHA